MTAMQAQMVVTRDLLARAARARPGEAQALEFRALHLSLPLVEEVADRLGLSAAQRRRVEHHALEGLHEAVRLFDPFGSEDFAEFAAALVEHEILAHLARPGLRLAAV